MDTCRAGMLVAHQLKMKKKLFLITSIVIAIGGSFSIFLFSNRRFSVIHPERADIDEAVYGLGKVKSSHRYEVITGIISTVTKRYVNEGDTVQKGAPLIKLNEQVLFRAPFNGTITYVNFFEGETAIPNVTVLRLENLQQKYIELSLEQQTILRVRLNQEARVSFESLRGNTLSGKVVAIFPRQDEFIVNIKVDQLDENILPGMTADVTIQIGKIKNAITLPLSAVKNGFITLKRNGRWEKVKADIGKIDGLSVEIKNPPLSEQDFVRVNTGG